VLRRPVEINIRLATSFAAPRNDTSANRNHALQQTVLYSIAWSKEFLEAGKRRLAGDTARAATSGEVKDLRREAQELKAVVAEQALELRLLKKSMIADGGDEE